MDETNVSVRLDSRVKKVLEGRAKAEMIDLDELISDILRRSALSYKQGASSSDKVDDKFLTFFSRKGKSKKK